MKKREAFEKVQYQYTASDQSAFQFIFFLNYGHDTSVCDASAIFLYVSIE